MYTVVIPCAGTGSRLGDATKYYNKALCTLGPKPIISYIIEHFSKEDEIIILLGYKGDYIKQVVTAIYPDWNITFREVDIYEGPLSGLGYSLTKAYDLLQKPFIFWSNDTVTDLNINEQDYSDNWIAVSEKYKGSKAYRHALCLPKGVVQEILPKDPKNVSVPLNLTSNVFSHSVEDSCYPYIGVSYIRDYEQFWLAYHDFPTSFVETGETQGLNYLDSLNAVFVNEWIDTGDPNILKEAQELYSASMEETILPKPNEAIWFIGNNVIKFHVDSNFVRDRIRRYEFLSELYEENDHLKIPRIIKYSNNLYVYEREQGTVASKIVNNMLLCNLLEEFFDSTYPAELQKEDVVKICKDFYRDKTLSRIKAFLDSTGEKDEKIIINGIECDPAIELVEKLDWGNLSKYCVFSRCFHGDFHLENILVQGKKNFVLLDWRQNFGKYTIDYGDLNYDLAKMWHSLYVNHDMVKMNLFNVEDISDKEKRIDIHRTFVDTECEELLKEMIENDPNYNLDFVRLITALIFLSISGCHEYPYSRFLFYLGKYLLNLAVGYIS